MRPLTNDEARRVEALIPRFYFSILSEVDRLAKERGAEDITDECGIALAIYLAAGASVESGEVGLGAMLKLLVQFGIDPDDMAELLGALAPHIESDHSEYVPLFHIALKEPSILALADQLHAFAEQAGINLDFVVTSEGKN